MLIGIAKLELPNFKNEPIVNFISFTYKIQIHFTVSMNEELGVLLVESSLSPAFNLQHHNFFFYLSLSLHTCPSIIQVIPKSELLKMLLNVRILT